MGRAACPETTRSAGKARWRTAVAVLRDESSRSVANVFTGPAAGQAWSVTAGRYVGTAVAGQPSLRTIDLGVKALQSASMVDLRATLRTDGTGGLVFDERSTGQFKYVALDVLGQKVLIGHADPLRGFVVDASVAVPLSGRAARRGWSAWRHSSS